VKRSILVLIGALVLVAPLAASSRVLVTARGAVGPLHMDTSTRADVIAFAGKPAGHSFGQYADYGRYEALGYGCRGQAATNRTGFPVCRTVFYIHVRSGLLEELYTADPKYVGPHGVHAGMSNGEAARLLHKPLPWLGCQDQALLGTAATGVLAVVQGDKRVAFLVVVAHKHASGVFDCIDS
jgi:hypothetical protein